MDIWIYEEDVNLMFTIKRPVSVALSRLLGTSKAGYLNYDMLLTQHTPEKYT